MTAPFVAAEVERGMTQSPSEANASPPRRGPVVLLVNPAAGKGKAGFELVRLRHHLADRGIEAEIYLTQAPGHAQRVLEGLPLEPGSLVVSVGGDGTVHEVGTALLDRPGVDLGVVPVGSGNDVARQLGMPKHPPDALDVILDGVAIGWDAGYVGPHAFLNTAGFVLSAETCHYSHHTGPLVGLARYGVAALRAWWNHHPLKLGLDGMSDSGERWVSLIEIGVGDRSGGGFKLTAKADPGDGLLDVCLLRAMPRWQMLLLMPRGRRGKHLGHPMVVYEQLGGLRLRLESDTRIHTDGEMRPLAKGEHSVRVKPRALRVRVGRDHPLASRALAPVEPVEPEVEEDDAVASSFSAGETEDTA